MKCHDYYQCFLIPLLRYVVLKEYKYLISKFVLETFVKILLKISVFRNKTSTSKWMVSPQLKWKEVFENFVAYDLGINMLASAATPSTNDDFTVDDGTRVQIWNSLASNMAMISEGLNKEGEK